MRDIKFRAWHEENGDFVYANIKQIWLNAVECMKGKNLSISNLDAYKAIDYVIENSFMLNANWEQYTGLKDKNGKEIYEGDIIKKRLIFPPTGKPEFYIDKVIFDTPSFSAFDMYLGNFSYTTYEVVGNIHENPELLK